MPISKQINFGLALTLDEKERLLPFHDLDMLLPAAATQESAGLDVRTLEALEIGPRELVSFRTGVKMTECTPGTFLIMELRSSMRFKKGLSQLGVGVIDADYRGEIKGLLFNTSNQVVKIDAFERVAQLLPMRSMMSCVAAKYISSLTRSGGFGSTGRS